MVCLGGKVAGCNIEMHDIRFVIGEKIEDTYNQLKQQWCGEKANLHMDSFLTVTAIDGYNVQLVETPPVQSDKKLYFVNLGAYYPTHIMEQHSFDLIVASDPNEAKEIAKSRAPKDVDKVHKDRLMEVDDLIQLTLIENHYIHLTYTGNNQTMHPQWYGYQLL